MSPMVHNIIWDHYILEYTEIIDVVRTSLVSTIRNFRHRILIFRRWLDAFDVLLTDRTSSQYEYDFSL